MTSSLDFFGTQSTGSTEHIESLRIIVSRRHRRLSQTLLFILTLRRKVSQSLRACPRRLREKNIFFCSFVKNKIPCHSVPSVCDNIFDIRTKEQIAPRPLRLCVRAFFTQKTRKTQNPCGDIFHTDGADFHRRCC